MPNDVSDIDLDALIEIYGSATEKVFAPHVLGCLRELRHMRAEVAKFSFQHTLDQEELDRLRAEAKAMREALDDLLSFETKPSFTPGGDDDYDWRAAKATAFNRARAALAQGGGNG